MLGHVKRISVPEGFRLRHRLQSRALVSCNMRVLCTGQKTKRMPIACSNAADASESPLVSYTSSTLRLSRSSSIADHPGQSSAKAATTISIWIIPRREFNIPAGDHYMASVVFDLWFKKQSRNVPWPWRDGAMKDMIKPFSRTRKQAPERVVAGRHSV